MGQVTLQEQAAPSTPSSGYMAIYPKSDKLVYAKGSDGVEIILGTQVFVGSSTRTLSTASGNVAYTGVGFKPKAVIFLATAAGQVGGTSWGFDGPSAKTMYDDYATTANTYNTTTSSILMQPATAGNYQAGSILTLDSDGFTIAWTKAGTPTGTGTFLYLCIR